MNSLNLIANTATLQDRDLYADITVDARRIIEDWTLSVMSLEWLDKKGRIKAFKDLKPVKPVSYTHLTLPTICSV